MKELKYGNVKQENEMIKYVTLDLFLSRSIEWFTDGQTSLCTQYPWVQLYDQCIV
jgi:hypothetical protein